MKWAHQTRLGRDSGLLQPSLYVCVWWSNSNHIIPCHGEAITIITIGGGEGTLMRGEAGIAYRSKTTKYLHGVLKYSEGHGISLSSCRVYYRAGGRGRGSTNNGNVGSSASDEGDVEMKIMRTRRRNCINDQSQGCHLSRYITSKNILLPITSQHLHHGHSQLSTKCLTTSCIHKVKGEINTLILTTTDIHDGAKAIQHAFTKLNILSAVSINKARGSMSAS
jgi:hypothetical protein